MNTNPSFYGARLQTGYILVTSMVFLLVLTMVAVFGIQYSVLEYQMGTNTAFTTQAMEASESGRVATSKILNAHIYERGWNDAVEVPASLEVLDKDNQDGIDLLYVDNSETPEALLGEEELDVDATYRLDGDGDAAYNGKKDVLADVAVYKTRVVNATGSGTAMVSGYEGLGKAAAAGGAKIFFELRSVGKAPNGAQVTTASDYRLVIRN